MLTHEGTKRPMRRFTRLISLCLFGLAAVAAPVAAQSGTALIEMEVDIAYDGAFRDEQWFPVRVTVTNNSDPIDGRVIVRPATSRGVRGSFSVPMDLPTNAVKSDTLWVVAQGVTTQLRVELIDNNTDQVLASQTAPLRALQPTDQLYVVVTRSAAGSVDLTNARAPGMAASQANWEIDNLPENPLVLASVNMMLFSDVDTGGLTLAQETALEAWIANGGHLVVTGGGNWQATAAGLASLLPYVPEADITVDDVTPLAAFTGSGEQLQGRTPLATGQLQENARVLVATENGEPLIIRQELGEGVVDYLTPDPNTNPLRSWAGLGQLWYTLAVTAPPVPAWARNFAAWEGTVGAAEILPGIDVLPSVLPLCGFLALYIALIGPVNYLVLSRLNRQEWAWVTIPLLIIVFSGLAFIVGGQLRGTTPSIGRVAVVRSWQDTDIAHVTEVIGLLSPQRTQYTMTGEPGTMFRSLPRNVLQGGGSLLASTFETSIEFQKAQTVSADAFTVDASFVAGFAGYGTTAAPSISGRATIFYPPSERSAQVVRGSVRNNTDQPLTDGVILARGAAYRLGTALDPGDVADFELRLDTFELPAPAPIGYVLGQANTGLGFNFSGGSLDLTVRDILGDADYDFNPNFDGNRGNANATERQEIRRRQLFLTALMREQYQSTARGNDVYFVGWSSAEATALTLADREYDAYPSTAHVVGLAVDVEQPLNKRVRVGSDQFTWSIHQRDGLGATAPINFSVGEGNAVAFRFTPLAQARLDDVEELLVTLQRNTSGNSALPVGLWNWDDAAWEPFTVVNSRLSVESPQPYLGPDNAVLVRVLGDDVAMMTFNSLQVEHVGTFEG
jgi:hypothetical protein